MFFAAAQTFSLVDIIKGAGDLVWPLLACSVVMVFIIFERLYALRKAAVMPQDMIDAIVAGRPVIGGRHTVLARIITFAEEHRNDEGAVKAFARLEVNRMERGLPYLDVIYAAAPLLGLTGTVYSLWNLFRGVAEETGLPDPVRFNQSIGLALSATLLGLAIAIPSLVGSGILQRRVEKYAAQLDVLLERILSSARGAKS